MAPSAALALREAYGDRKPPDITRKITACVACRKLKIKCHMMDSKPPCTRCKGRGLPCTVNKSLQMLLENDVTWKEQLQQRVEQLERLVASGIQSSSNPGTSSEPFSQELAFIQPIAPWNANQPLQSMKIQMIPGQASSTVEVSLNFTCSLGAFPASSIQDSPTPSADPAVDMTPDIVSQGILSKGAAQAHFQYFCENLNRYMHRILPEGDSWEAARARSPLLATAVCTVAAFCSGSPDYAGCLETFQAGVSRKTFAREHSFDEIRALCIGAFWLSDISYALCSLAVRLASEVNLHRCITKMPHSNPKCYERTRLYFIVFHCDHHCSLRYGRPPMTRALRSLKNPRALLQSEHSTSVDVLLISEMELWTLNSQVFNTFGADVGSTFDVSRCQELESIGRMFDRWKSEWSQILSLRNEYEQVKTLLDLHVSASKLCLYSHIFRGSGPAYNARPHAGHLDGTFNTKQVIEQHAINSASSFIRLAVDFPASWLLPSYFGTMTAFSCVFLLRVLSHTALLAATGNHKDIDEAVLSLQRLSALLPSVLSEVQATHPLAAVAKSLPLALAGRISPLQDGQMEQESYLQTATVCAPDAAVEDLALLDFENDLFRQALDADTGWMAFPFAGTGGMDAGCGL